MRIHFLINMFNWNRSVCAPPSVSRPNPRNEDGVFFFFSDNNGPLDHIWERIQILTREGRLGYYAGYSDDSQVISVHHSRAYNRIEMNAIECKFAELGLYGWQIKKKDQVN